MPGRPNPTFRHPRLSSAVVVLCVRLVVTGVLGITSVRGEVAAFFADSVLVAALRDDWPKPLRMDGSRGEA